MSESPEKMKLESDNPKDLKLDAFRTIFPGVISDGVIDASKLAAEIGIDVKGVSSEDEGFGLIWSGKKNAVLATNTPTYATVKPKLQESTSWDSAQNVFIEGDNLEVLKLMQKAYNDKVKLIYIDPPYNTGNDFVYSDDFSDPVKHYLKVTGQIDDEGNKTRANTDASGRKSSNWLSMMYPRLQLARNLLTQDGSIFVSIDDNEVAHLRELLDDIFGPENFIGQFIWAAGRKNDAKFVSTSHEYILCYARNMSTLVSEIGEWRSRKEGLDDIYKKYEELLRIYGSNIENIQSELRAWFKSLSNDNPAKRHKHYNSVDENGIFFPSDTSAPDNPDRRSHKPLIHPVTGKPCAVPKNGWRWTEDTLMKLVDENKILYGKDESTVPQYKGYLRDREWEAPYSVFYQDGRGATKRLAEFLGAAIFDFPKDELIIQKIIEFACDSDGIILDFFAGSGTTGHSTFLQNAKDGGKRRFVLVNIPEPTNEKSLAFKKGITSVSEITRMRLNKALEVVPGAKEQGLKYLNLAASNFLIHDIAIDDQLQLSESTLNGPVDIDSIATEVLLKNGVRLDETWHRPVELNEGLVIAANVAVWVSLKVDIHVFEQLIDKYSIHTIVFLEDAFISKDDLKANLFFKCKKSNIAMKTV